MFFKEVMWEKCGGFEVPGSRFPLSWLSLLTVYCIFLFLSQRMEKDYPRIDYECLLDSDKSTFSLLWNYIHVHVVNRVL